jgi:hypothetical protein
MRHKVEIPIWQDPEGKPIPGFPPMPKTIIKWLKTEEYKAWLVSQIGSRFNPSDYILFNKVETDNGDYTEVRYELRHKPTLIEQYKKAAYYE